MTQEKLQNAVQAWNGLSAEKKQGIWNGFVDTLSKVDVNELSFPEQTSVDGGQTGIGLLAMLVDNISESFNGTRPYQKYEWL
jgi:hypothetical protein